MRAFNNFPYLAKLTVSIKLVWFMAPNKSLSEQQLRILETNLPAFSLRGLTGADNVDKWTTKELWNAFLTGVHVVVGTPAVLADALTHGFVTLSRLSLCVFDEAHRCIKGDPMNKIMRDFYHPAKRDGRPTPHILALSASPVMHSNASQRGLQEIESNLDATTITPTRHRDELDAYVHPPQLIKVEYSGNHPDQVPAACRALDAERAIYDFEQDPYVLELQGRRDSAADRNLQKVRDTGKTYCAEQLKLLSNPARHINEHLGPYIAEWYILTCTSRYLESRGNSTSLIADLEAREKRHLETIFRRIVYKADCTSTAVTTHDVADKARALLDFLSNNIQAGFRGIIFVEQRAMVFALAHLLRFSELSSEYKVGMFVGTSTSSDRHTSTVDLFDPKSHLQDLQDFRDGSKNLMIATNVLEEGIDIPACNCVICFDLPKNLISFVQGRGRARKPNSQYIHFTSANDIRTNLSTWQALEDAMKEAYMDEERAVNATLGMTASADDGDASRIKYAIECTGALITLDNARGHLHHFCSVATRDSSRYTDQRPKFMTAQDPVLKTWTASVTLPSSAHGTVRTAQSSRSWVGEQAATKEAAFIAYRALHQAGLINDNLLPAIETPAPEPGKHVEQPSLVQAGEQQSIWNIHANLDLDTDTTWYASQISLCLSGHEVLSQLLWLPFRIDAAEKVQLHWNADVHYEASIRPIPRASLDADERSKAADWTSLVLRSVFSSSIPAERRNFAVLLSPPGGKAAADLAGVHVPHDFANRHQAHGSLGELRHCACGWTAWKSVHSERRLRSNTWFTGFHTRCSGASAHRQPIPQAANLSQSAREQPVQYCSYVKASILCISVHDRSLANEPIVICRLSAINTSSDRQCWYRESPQ